MAVTKKQNSQQTVTQTKIKDGRYREGACANNDGAHGAGTASAGSLHISRLLSLQTGSCPWPPLSASRVPLMELSHTHENGVFRIIISNKYTTPGLIGPLAIALSSIAVFQFFSIKLMILLILTTLVLLAYAYFTVVAEHLEVFDSIHGFQYSKFRLIGIKEVQFIHSQRLVIHEVITLVSTQRHEIFIRSRLTIGVSLSLSHQQRVITFLSCIVGPDEAVTGDNFEKFNLINILSSIRVPKSMMKQVYSLLMDAFAKTEK